MENYTSKREYTTNPYLLAYFHANHIRYGEEYKSYEYMFWIDRMHNEYHTINKIPEHKPYNDEEYFGFLKFLARKANIAIVYLFMDQLPTNPAKIWTDGSMVYTATKEDCNKIADLFEKWGYQASTGYYDPEEDNMPFGYKRNDAEDGLTGYYYAEAI